VVYRADADFLRAMRDAARQTHQAERSFHHDVHMARKNCRQYLRGETVRLKKYLYVLRPLLATLWIESGHGMVPMQFQDLVDALVTDPPLHEAIARLLAIKRAAMESAYGEQLPIIDTFIDAELSRLESVLPPLPRDTDFSILDRWLMETVLQWEATRTW
jgi:hypothetical protein